MASIKSSIDYLQKESLIFYEHGSRPAQSQPRAAQSYAEKLLETMNTLSASKTTLNSLMKFVDSV
jgi:hypothetical protein